MAKNKPQHDDSLVCRNKKASHKFELLERIECGLVLKGAEVKSLRERQASLDEAYARIEGDELWLLSFHITQYSHDRSPNHEPMRRKKLLIHTRELRKLKPKIDQRGLTLVPIRVYFNDRGIAKVEIALARGKSVADKRQSLKKRTDQREMERAVRRR